MRIFKKDKESILVDSNILELYLPEDYYDSSLFRRTESAITVFGLGNYRVMSRESDILNRDSLPTHPLCIPSFFSTKPREVDVSEIQLYPKGTKVKCIVLRYYRTDIFMVNATLIKSSDNMNILFDRFLAGKLDHLPYEAIYRLIVESQKINNLNLRLSPEDLEALVAQKCRDVKNETTLARFSKVKPYNILSVNPRVDMGMSSTFNMINFEDINTALVVAHNRKKANTEEQENIIEKIVKGEKILPDK